MIRYSARVPGRGQRKAVNTRTYHISKQPNNGYIPPTKNRRFEEKRREYQKKYLRNLNMKQVMELEINRMETKSLTIGADWRKGYVLKSGHYVLEGYASTTDRDSDGDIVTLEALEGQGVMDRIQQGAVKLALDHNYSFNENGIIGVVIDGEVDEKGLYIKAMIHKDNANINDIRKKIAKGILNHMSIGYNVRKAYHGKDKNGEKTRFITEMTLMEVSIVAMPANPHARIMNFDRSEEEVNA